MYFPNSIRIKYKLAETYFKFKEFEKALTNLDAIKEIASNYKNINELYGRIHFARSEYEKAVEYLNKAIITPENFVDVYLHKTIAYVNLIEFDDAKTGYSAMVKKIAGYPIKMPKDFFNVIVANIRLLENDTNEILRYLHKETADLLLKEDLISQAVYFYEKNLYLDYPAKKTFDLVLEYYKTMHLIGKLKDDLNLTVLSLKKMNYYIGNVDSSFREEMEQMELKAELLKLQE